MRKIKFYPIFLLAIILFFAFANKIIAAEFDPNYIISDQEYLDNTTMTLGQIQQFLDSKGGFLANYRTQNAKGEIKSAAEIIYDAANNNYDCDGDGRGANMTEAQKQAQCKKVTINPKLLLVLLQKEMSLIEEKNPTQRQLDWAVGYGCPDNQPCNPRWQGFGKQINSASLQFFDYMMNPGRYTYKAGQTYTVTNTGRPPSVITPVNQATAALYNYTPHVYHGNYNFFILWNRYFTRLYPNGSLLQAKGEVGVWLIQNGEKRAFLSKGALTSRFDLNKVITVAKSELDSYPVGKPIKYPQYSVLRSPRGTIFLIVDDTRRGFDSQEAFRKVGINPAEIIDAGWDDINLYAEGKPITATSTYVTGALLQNNKTGGVYWVADGTKAPIWDRVLLKTKYKFKPITPVDPTKLDSYETVEPAIFGDGELIKSELSPAVYVIENKKRRPFLSGEVFENLGYKWSNIITVPEKIIKLYEEGQPVGDLFRREETENQSNKTSLENINTNGATSTATTTATSTLITEEINSILNP